MTENNETVVDIDATNKLIKESQELVEKIKVKTSTKKTVKPKVKPALDGSHETNEINLIVQMEYNLTSEDGLVHAVSKEEFEKYLEPTD